MSGTLLSDGSLAPEPMENRSSTTSIKGKGMEDSNRREAVYEAAETSSCGLDLF